MPPLPRQHHLLAWILGLLLLWTAQGCEGCSPATPRTSEAADASSADAATPTFDAGNPDGLDSFFGISSDTEQAVMFELVGKPDGNNRYPSAVMLHAQSPSHGTRLRQCGGVIVAPRLVVTAGHCVCHRHAAATLEGQMEDRIDATTCAKTATVRIFFYEQEPRNPEQIRGFAYTERRGRVRPHSELHIRLSEQNQLLSSHADLATLLLDEPVPVGFRAAVLAKSPVVPGETLRRVGFGYDDKQQVLDGRRLVEESKVLKPLSLADGTFLFTKENSYLFRGDSGGPCFRETRDGPRLVGISTTGLGQEPTMISVHPYGDWLRDEVSRAATAEMPPAPGATP